MKICSKCKISKNLNEFYKDNRTKDKLQYQCKICQKERQQSPEYKKYIKEYYKTPKNKQLQREYQKSLKFKQYLKQYHNTIEYKEKHKKAHKKWYNKNKKYYKNKNENDPTYKLLQNLRRRIRHVLKGNNKSAKTIELIGCSVELLKHHLQLQFIENMTWENQGKWHIDHKIPCSFFDLSNPEEQRKCFHYSNLQPLWAIDNLKKSNKIIKNLKEITNLDV